MNNDTAKTLLLDSARMLMLKINEDLMLIEQNAWSDDDTDTMPARARTLSYIIEGLANSDMEPQESLEEMLENDEMRADIATSDWGTPLLDALR